MRKRKIQAKIRVACRDFLEGRADAIEACWTLNRFDCRENVAILEQDVEVVERVYMGSEKRSMLIDKWHPSVLPEKLLQYQQLEAEIRQEINMICERILSANPRRSAASEVAK
jgi:predicted nucleic acid-binding OB-fold protein